MTVVSTFKELSRPLSGMADKHQMNRLFKYIVPQSSFLEINLLCTGIKGGRTKRDSNPRNRGHFKGE